MRAKNSASLKKWAKSETPVETRRGTGDCITKVKGTSPKIEIVSPKKGRSGKKWKETERIRTFPRGPARQVETDARVRPETAAEIERQRRYYFAAEDGAVGGRVERILNNRDRGLFMLRNQ